MLRQLTLLSICAMLSSCGQAAEEPQARPAAAASVESPPQQRDATAAAEPSPSATPSRSEAAPVLIGEAIVRREWARAENRANCAPITVTDSADAGGTPRRAHFSGGWAVAFDLPAQRSAYGIAGVGALADDDAPEAEHRAALARQWPLVRQLDALPAGSTAGYGLEGAAPYSAANPSGRGEQSVAYVRVAGQKCLYNLWSRLGRTHLETMLDNLRLLPPLT